MAWPAKRSAIAETMAVFKYILDGCRRSGNRDENSLRFRCLVGSWELGVGCLGVDGEGNSTTSFP